MEERGTVMGYIVDCVIDIPRPPVRSRFEGFFVALSVMNTPSLSSDPHGPDSFPAAMKNKRQIQDSLHCAESNNIK